MDIDELSESFNTNVRTKESEENVGDIFKHLECLKASPKDVYPLEMIFNDFRKYLFLYQNEDDTDYQTIEDHLFAFVNLFPVYKETGDQRVLACLHRSGRRALECIIETHDLGLRSAPTVS